MSNAITKSRAAPAPVPGAQVMAPPGAQVGQWMWDGTQWVCGCDGGLPPVPPVWPPGPPPWYPPPQGQPPWYPGANGGVSFGTTAPPNPIRGAFWFDGIALWLFDGAAWEDVGVANIATGGGGGASTGTAPPASPSDGALWYNGSTLNVWDGTAWVPTSTTKTYIQTTAPPAPNPGDQWWNGVQMYIWSGSTWNLVGPGATVGPTPTTKQVFSIGETQNQPITASTWMIAPFSTNPTIDTMGAFNAVTKMWTPNVAGIYAIVMRGIGVGTIYGGIIAKNDQGTFNVNMPWVTVYTEYPAGSGPSSGWFDSMGITKMNGSTDFLRYWTYSQQGEWYASANQPYFEAYILP